MDTDSLKNQTDPAGDGQEFNFIYERKTVPEAARYLGTSVQFLRNDAVTNRHGIPRIKVGSKVFYLKRDLDAYLLRQRKKGGSA